MPTSHRLVPRVLPGVSPSWSSKSRHRYWATLGGNRTSNLHRHPVEPGLLSADSAMTVPALASTPADSVPPSPIKGVTHAHIDRPLTPRTSSGASRTSSHRRSKTFISPSPLSSTVTTVVKDAFLRGHNVAEGKKTSLKRIRSSIRASLFFHDEEDRDMPGHHEVVAALLPDDHQSRVAAVDLDNENHRQRMSRSVSDALGDFFRSRKRKPGDGQGDVASDAETGTRPAD